MFNKPAATNKAILVNNDTHTVTIATVLEQEGNILQVDGAVLDIKDAKAYVNDKHGGLVYLFAVDLPAKVEAAHLHTLRKSVALKRMFEFNNKDGSIDWGKILPWIFTLAVVVFK